MAYNVQCCEELVLSSIPDRNHNGFSIPEREVYFRGRCPAMLLIQHDEEQELKANFWSKENGLYYCRAHTRIRENYDIISRG